jgi:cardiolipin synthase
MQDFFAMVLDHFLHSWLTLLIPIFHLLGIASALEALYYSRSSQGAIAWGLFLAIFPYAGLPIYWVFGRTKFRGYKERIQCVVQHNAKGLAWYQNHTDTHSTTPDDDERGRMEGFVTVCGAPFLGGNTVEILVDGEATFRAIFDAIDGAHSYIAVEYFIIKDDELGAAFKEKLIAAARRNVKVFVLIDEVGSHQLPSAYLQELAAAGVEATRFGTRRGFLNFFQINFRNHRKLVIVDGRDAFLGGINVGDEYMNRDPRFGHWRDSHIRISGPSVVQALGIFIADWVWATGAVPPIQPTASTATGGTPALVFGNGPVDEQDRCVLFFLHCISSARTRVWISSPYFVPDEALLSALQLAALRGVDVRIMIPEKRDHTLVWLASFFYVPAVTSYGVKVYRYKDGFLHQKAVVVDDTIAVIGSTNFDNRSFRLNFEASCIVADRETTQHLARILENDMNNSNLISNEGAQALPLWKRVGAKFARLFAPLL